MRHHPCSPFGRISKAVSAASIGLALGVVATPFAAARSHRFPDADSIGLRHSIAEPDRLARSHGHANHIGIPLPFSGDDTRRDGQSDPGSIGDAEPHGPTVAKSRGGERTA